MRAYEDALSEIKDELMMAIPQKKKKGRKHKRKGTTGKEEPRARKPRASEDPRQKRKQAAGKEKPRARKPKDLYEVFEDAVKKLSQDDVVCLGFEIEEDLKLLSKFDGLWIDGLCLAGMANDMMKTRKMVLNICYMFSHLMKRKDPKRLNKLIFQLSNAKADERYALLKETVHGCQVEIGVHFDHVHEPSGTKPKLKAKPKQEDFEELGIPNTAPWAVIKKAYRTEAQKWHPDKHKGKATLGQAEEKFPKLAEAFERLGKAREFLTASRKLPLNS